MVLAGMLTDAFCDHQDGIHFGFTTDGELLISWRPQTATKVKETVIKDFLFVDDDCALNASREQKMQHENGLPLTSS
jgi:hypothetical protein